MFASNIIIDLFYNLSNYIQLEVFENCLKWVAYINILFSPCYRLGRNRKLLKCLRISITVVYFKDRNWICKTVYCISSLVVCKIAFCSEFPDIPDSAGRKTRRRRTHAIAKRYAFHPSAIRKQFLDLDIKQLSRQFIKRSIQLSSQSMKERYLGQLLIDNNWF